MAKWDLISRPGKKGGAKWERIEFTPVSLAMWQTGRDFRVLEVGPVSEMPQRGEKATNQGQPSALARLSGVCQSAAPVTLS